jgi:hypothetical protein
VNGGATMTLDRSFLVGLRHVYESLRPRVGSDFVPALRRAFDSLPGCSGADLARLGEALSAWRSRTVAEVNDRLKDLPPDDPLYCPVSLFGTLGYSRLETAHTRSLAWLLNPKGEHGFSDALLRRLLGACWQGRKIEGLQVDVVKPEHQIEGRRLDVFACGAAEADGKTTPFVLVIEGKIDAEAGERQLRDYAEWVREHHGGREAILVFLTADGAAAGDEDGDWHALSFADLIMILREGMEELRQTQGYHYLRYYLAGVLRDVCRWPIPLDPRCVNPHQLLDYLGKVGTPKEPQ